MVGRVLAVAALLAAPAIWIGLAGPRADASCHQYYPPCDDSALDICGSASAAAARAWDLQHPCLVWKDADVAPTTLVFGGGAITSMDARNAHGQAWFVVHGQATVDVKTPPTVPDFTDLIGPADCSAVAKTTGCEHYDYRPTANLRHVHVPYVIRDDKRMERDQGLFTLWTGLSSTVEGGNGTVSSLNPPATVASGVDGPTLVLVAAGSAGAGAFLGAFAAFLVARAFFRPKLPPKPPGGL
jgi:hypothetical protein